MIELCSENSDSESRNSETKKFTRSEITRNRVDDDGNFWFRVGFLRFSLKTEYQNHIILPCYKKSWDPNGTPDDTARLAGTQSYSGIPVYKQYTLEF